MRISVSLQSYIDNYWPGSIYNVYSHFANLFVQGSFLTTLSSKAKEKRFCF